MKPVDISVSTLKFLRSKAPHPKEFSEFLGTAAWLMSLSAKHRKMPVGYLDSHVLPAILLKQFRIITKSDMPVAFLSWALVSDEIEQSGKVSNGKLGLEDWRSGPNMAVVACISPFAPSAEVIERFLQTET
ncbi:MAG: toxin-activating lysine-acyltransferase [Paracoccaceae bacterium]